MDSEYLLRAKLGMTGDFGARPPGLGFRGLSGSPSKSSYLLDAMPSSGANKRPRPVDADAVTLDNYHVSKRYLTEMMASSLNLLKVGDSKEDANDAPPMSELLSSSLPSEGGLTERLNDRPGSLPRYSSTTLSAGGDDMMSNAGDSAMSDDNGDTDDDSSPGSWRRGHMMMQEAHFKSPEASMYGRRSMGGGLAASNLATSSGPEAWRIPAPTSIHPYAIPSRHQALQQKEGDCRLPPSPSDPAQSANLRRAALLRSLQMRGQAPTAHSPTQVPSGLGQSVSSGFKLGPSALAMGNPPEFRLTKGVEAAEAEGEGEPKPGWVPAPGTSQSPILSPVPEMDPQDGAMMDESGGGQEGAPTRTGGAKDEEDGGQSVERVGESPTNRTEAPGSRVDWRRANGWSAPSVKKDLNANWEQDEKRAISDFRPGGSQWGALPVRKWGVVDSGQKRSWSPQGRRAAGTGPAEAFGGSARPAKGLWGGPKSPPKKGFSYPPSQQKSPQWKPGASNLMEEKDDPLSPGKDPMSPGWGTDSEDFPPLSGSGKKGLKEGPQGERKVGWKPRLKANNLELTSSADYGSFTDKGSYMHVARSRSAKVPFPIRRNAAEPAFSVDPSLSKLGTSAVAGPPTFGGREKKSEEAPSAPESFPATAMEDDAQDKDESHKASPSIFAAPTFIPALLDQPTSGSKSHKHGAPMRTSQQPGVGFSSSPRPGFYQSSSPEFRGVQQGSRQSPLQGSPSPPPGSLTAAFNRSFTWSAGATTPPPERGLPTGSRGFGTGLALSFATPHREQSAEACVPPTPGAPLFHRRRPSIVIQNSAKDDPPEHAENMEGT